MAKIVLIPNFFKIKSDQSCFSLDYLKYLQGKYSNKRLISKLTYLSIIHKLLVKYHNYEDCFIPKIEIGEYGKPFFVNKNLPSFSISHTDDFLLIGICEQNNNRFEEISNIGVDVEQIKTRKNILGISERFYSLNEHQYVSYEQEFLNERFFKLWVIRESLTKYQGRGLGAFDDPNLIRIDTDPIKLYYCSKDVTDKCSVLHVTSGGKKMFISIVSDEPISEYLIFHCNEFVKLPDMSKKIYSPDVNIHTLLENILEI